MRNALAVVSILALALGAPVPAQAQTGAAQLFNQMVDQKCNKPDNKLIKPGTTETYDAQAKGFNDCLRIYIESENNKIARIRADASAEIARVTASANSQFRDIERAINSAIIEVKIVNAKAQPADLPPSGDVLTGFPAPVCPKPDEALLGPQGKRAPSLASTDRYEAQRRSYEACVRVYIAQAEGEIAQIKTNAQASFRRVTDDANLRIKTINDAVSQAVADARAAAGERNAAVYAVRSPFGMSGHSLDGIAGLGMADLPQMQPERRKPDADSMDLTGVESVTVTGHRLTRSAGMPSGDGDPDAISCRAPQPLIGSRMMGPEICKYNREWARLNEAGLNISSDGKRIVQASGR